ncbi:MAG: hypothetical protein RCO49_03650 [Rickettsia endosymbiont of Argas persicus]
MLNKLYKILFINLFLITLQSYATPPALPPSLPNPEPKIETKEANTNTGLSIFDKLKQFFSKSPKKVLPTQSQNDPKLTSQESNKNETNEHENNTNLAAHSNALEAKENDDSEPFIDVGSTPLPSAANKEHDNNTNLATELAKKPATNDASEPFIDVDSTPLPSAANKEHDGEISHINDKNLAYNNLPPVTPNVSQPLVTMPPLEPGSYVVPATPPVQVYKLTSLPPVHIPTPLKPPPDSNVEQSKAVPSNTAPAVMPPTSVTPAVDAPIAPSSPTPTVTPAATSAPTTPPATTQPAVVPTPAVAPPTPNMPPAPCPVINSPVAPNTTPNNLPATPPVTTPTPAVPKVPSVPTTTDSSSGTNNQQQGFTAIANTSKKQDWDTPLEPVEVLTAVQNQNSNNNVILPTTNQTQSQPKNTSSSNVSTNVKKQDNIINTEITEAATKFAKDESQMLLLPDDDIVLGKLTEPATLEQMDIYSYIKLVQKKEAWIVNASKRKTVESLIKFDNDLNKKKDITATLSYCSAIDNSFRAIDRNNLSKLRVLLDVYPILQEKNRQGDTLLTAAVYNDNYYLAKYLVIRGIKISTLNAECQYPLDIALARGNNSIACMLTKAKGY